MNQRFSMCSVMVAHARRLLHCLCGRVSQRLVARIVTRISPRLLLTVGLVLTFTLISVAGLCIVGDGSTNHRQHLVKSSAVKAPEPTSNTLPPPFFVVTGCSGEQNRRQQHLLEVCKTFKHRGLSPDYTANSWLKRAQHIYVLESHKAIFCFIPHTTSLLAWKHKLLAEYGVFPEMDIDPEDVSWVAKVNDVWEDMHARLGVRLLSTYKRPEVDYLTTHYFKFTSVRHPLDRLYANYYEKVLDPVTSNNTAYQSRIGDIKRAFQEEDRPGPMRYELYVKDLIANYPSFDEMHDRLAIDFCDPCAIYYNFIVKYESHDQDVQCLLKHLNMSPYFPNYKLPKIKANKEKNIGPRLMSWLRDDIISRDLDIFEYYVSSN